ncbi:MAG: acyltransferase family protein [Christensenellaceae bacterium]
MQKQFDETAVCRNAPEQRDNELKFSDNSNLQALAATKKRDNAIDAMKGLLVLLMIFAHIIQFFEGGALSDYFSVYVNLTTFSGFMFCLGYVFPIAYTDKPDAERKMFYAFLKTLVAFYISGAAFMLIIEKQLTFYNLINIVILRLIPMYSEFLLSLALVFAFGIFLFKPLKNLAKSPVRYFLITTVCLLMTAINYSAVTDGLLASVIGSSHFNNFPIVQYGFFFLMGFYLSERKIIFNLPLLIFSAVGSLVFLLFFLKYGEFPSRFPPSLSWIVGGSLSVYCYYLFFKLTKISTPFSFIGKNSLIFLLVSNVAIFTAKALFPLPAHLGPFRITVYVIVVAICLEIALIKHFALKYANKKRKK